MEYLNIIIRMIFFYFFIILIYRIMGKREVGQLGIVDLIVSILIAELVAISVEDTGKSILNSVIPIISLVVLQILLSYGSLKSFKLRNLLDGSPSFIIEKGKINYHEMIRQKYNLDDLLSQLREKGYKCVEGVEYAILENNGTLSIFSYKDSIGEPMPLILDGRIDKETLKRIDKKEEDIYRLLDKKKIKLNEVFYAFYHDRDLFIIKYCDLK